MNHSILIFALFNLGIAAQLEACCLPWRSKSKVAPAIVTPISIHQRDLSSDISQKLDYEKIKNAVDRLPLPQVGTIHFNAKAAVIFDKVAPEAKAIYLGEIARRYQENKDEIDAMIEQSNERYRKVIWAPKVHTIHEQIKIRKKAKRNRLPSIFPSDILREQEKLFGEGENIIVAPPNSPEESVAKEPTLAFMASSSEQSSPTITS